MEVLSSMTLQDVLTSREHLPWDSVLFLPPDPSTWCPETPALVLASDDVDEDDRHPEATRRGLRYVLGVADVQDIKLNAVSQRPDASLADVIAALRFYFANDAFLVWP